MGRAPCCDKANVKKGPWSPEEDTKLKQYIQTHGTGGNWIVLPQKAGLRRCGKSCRLRWLNYLRPNIKHGEFSDDEDKIICTLFASIGSRWSIMAAQLPGRTDNDIKNYWNTKLKKKMINSLVSIPEIRKPLHHLQSFNSPMFHNNTNININAPLSSSPNSSYLFSTNTNSSYDHDQTLTANVSDHHHHGYIGLGPMGRYNGVKDSSTLVMFGGDQASSSSNNSDGSVHYEYGSSTINVGVYDHGNNMGNLKSDYENEKGYYGDSSLDSSLEEIKQLISTNLCNSNIDNNLNFFADDHEIKEVEKLVFF